jgi:hypothetical protein
MSVEHRSTPRSKMAHTVSLAWTLCSGKSCGVGVKMSGSRFDLLFGLELEKEFPKGSCSGRSSDAVKVPTCGKRSRDASDEHRCEMDAVGTVFLSSVPREEFCHYPIAVPPNSRNPEVTLNKLRSVYSVTTYVAGPNG